MLLAHSSYSRLNYRNGLRCLALRQVHRERRLPALRHHPRSKCLTCYAEQGSGSNASRPADGSSSATGLAKSLLRDVVSGLNTAASSGGSTTGRSTTSSTALHEDLRSPSYAIAAANVVVFLLCALVPVLPAAALLLNHKQPQIWQLLTSCFAHTSLESVLQCVFFAYVFGRVVERNHGSVATWAVYIACGAAATALAWWMLPARAGLLSSAAPAAAWGLFLVGIGLPRAAKKPLEVACLGPFAYAATVGRYAPLSGALTAEGTAVGHLVHAAGASVAAAVAVAVLSVVERWRAAEEEKRREARRQAEAASTEDAINRAINLASQAAAHLGKKLG